jgi:zinc transport system permease protein
MMHLWYAAVGSLPFEWTQYTFMKTALLAVILLTPLFALLGCLIVNKQMAFFSDAVGHSALTGIAIGALLGLAEPAWAMVAFAVVLAVVFTVARRYAVASADTVVGLVMAFAVALGVVILSRGGGFASYSRYLIGDLLSVTAADCAWIAALAATVGVLWVVAFNTFFLVSVNSSLARTRGIPVWPAEAAFAAIVAVVVTVSVQWVGLLIINSLIVLPAATARNVARSMRSYVLVACAVSLCSGVAGLIASYYLATATGATIVLVSMCLFVLSLAGVRRAHA